MIPWILLDTAKVQGGDDLRLLQRGTEFSIRSGTAELMNSRLHGSEEALARASCARLAGRRSPRILIGGLGMGFTLRAALAALPPDAQVEVGELSPAVVEWARGPLAALHGDSLADPRLTIHVADVARLIAAARSAYDAILLDVDNGPQGLVSAANDRIYGAQGLAAARQALRPGGVLAVWSAAPDEKFTRHLQRSGFAVTEERVRADGARKRGGARHTLWFATPR